MQVHRHVDRRLQAEQDGEARRGKADERLFAGDRMAQRADHDEGEQRQQHQAEHDAELLGADREHEVGVALRQEPLHRALARATAEPAAAREAFQREIDVEGVARAAIHEALDALGDVRHGEIGADQAQAGDARKPADPDQPHPGHEEQRAPHQRDQHGLAEVRLHHQQRSDREQQRERHGVGGHLGPPRRFRKQPGDQDDESGLEELGRLDVDAAITSQRRAPLISAPKNGVIATRNRLTRNTTSATRRRYARRQQ